MKIVTALCEFALEAIEDNEGIYIEERLIEALDHIIRPNMNMDEIRDSLIQISLELTTDMEPKWQYAASRLYVQKLHDEVRKNRGLDKEEDLYSNL